MTAIETTGLTKQHGDVTAVADLDLAIEEGTVFGFLGPNGAGKSTTINCLLDYSRPTRGHATLLGYDAQTESLAVRQHTGVLPEGVTVYDRLTGRQHLRFAIESKDVSDDPAAIAERVGLADAIDQRAGGYSKGMAQRLMLGTALVGQPELLILDEPSTGLDPGGTRDMREIVREEASRGATVFFSSHILGQVEAVCDRVGILQDGQLVAEDTVAGLRNAVDSEATLTVEVDRVPEGTLDAVRSLPGVMHVSATGTTVTARCGNDAKTAVLNELDAVGASIHDFELAEVSLEEVFMAYTSDGLPTNTADANDGHARAPDSEGINQ
jgi:ABC-2 type transport system ATP-binding protein